MVNLELVLDFLANNRIRATYGAVGAATGIHERSLRHEHQFRGLDPRTAWVVYAATRQPPPFHARRPDDSELIRDGDELVHRVSAREHPGIHERSLRHEPRGGPTAPSDREPPSKTQDQPAAADNAGCLVALTIFVVIALAFSSDRSSTPGEAPPASERAALLERLNRERGWVPANGEDTPEAREKRETDAARRQAVLWAERGETIALVLCPGSGRADGPILRTLARRHPRAEDQPLATGQYVHAPHRYVHRRPHRVPERLRCLGAARLRGAMST